MSQREVHRHRAPQPLGRRQQRRPPLRQLWRPQLAAGRHLVVPAAVPHRGHVPSLPGVERGGWGGVSGGEGSQEGVGMPGALPEHSREAVPGPACTLLPGPAAVTCHPTRSPAPGAHLDEDGAEGVDALGGGGLEGGAFVGVEHNQVDLLTQDERKGRKGRVWAPGSAAGLRRRRREVNPSAPQASWLSRLAAPCPAPGPLPRTRLAADVLGEL